MLSKLNYFVFLFCFLFFTQAYAQAWNPENLLLYPIEKPTRFDQRIFLDQPLPSNLAVGDMVAIRAAKGEFEPASFATRFRCGDLDPRTASINSSTAFAAGPKPTPFPPATRPTRIPTYNASPPPAASPLKSSTASKAAPNTCA